MTTNLSTGSVNELHGPGNKQETCIPGELAMILNSWATDPGFAPLALDRMCEIATRFARYQTVTHHRSLCDLTSEVCARFIDAPTRTGTVATINTRHFRRTTIRTGRNHEFREQVADGSS